MAKELQSDPAAIEKRLSSLLKHALLTSSSFDIALILGSAAELKLFPEPHVLEQCTAALQESNQPALRGLVWAVRHRSAKGGKNVRRFVIEDARSSID